jgi:AraC family transcriptional regulator
VSKRLPVTLPEIGRVMSAAFGEVYGYLGAHGIQPDGPPFVIYHGVPRGDDPFDIEICAPVAAAPDAPTGWHVQELPAGTFATMLHVGPYDTLGAAYGRMTAGLGAHQLANAGPPREVYLSEPGTPPEELMTIIEFPVIEVASPVVAG